MAAALGCKALPAGKIRIDLSEDGKTYSLEASAQDVGGLTVAILAAAKTSCEHAGIAPHPPQSSLEGVQMVRASRVGVVPDMNGVPLLLHFGLARVGIFLDRDQARALAEKILTLSTPQDRPQ
jgi:hypothetical protein